MKVCMVGVFDYLNDARVKAYAEALVKKGSHVDILEVRSSEGARAAEKNGVRIFSLRVAGNRGSSLAYFFEYGLALFKLIFRLTTMNFQSRYDVIHFHNMPDFLVFSALFTKLTGTKIILDIHDAMPEVFNSKFPGQKYTILLALVRLEEKISVMFSDAVITANAHFRANMQNRGVSPEKFVVVKNFPDPEHFNSTVRRETRAAANEQFNLIFPGTLAARYGLDVAIRALPLLRDRIKSPKLIIIGPQNEYYKSVLLPLVQELDVEELVEFKPPIPNDQIPAQLAQADLGIYPAMPDSHMTIAIPGKLLEFAAMGLPFISSRLRIVEEMFDEGSLLFFEPGNEREFADCVVRLYENPVLRAEIATRAEQNYNQRHSGSSELQVYWDLLEELAPGRM
jgi:glycosyltransferase involved in cell wall biosynthesis